MKIHMNSSRIYLSNSSCFIFTQKSLTDSNNESSVLSFQNIFRDIWYFTLKIKINKIKINKIK